MKGMSEHLKTSAIGLFIVVAIGIVIWVLLFLRPTVGDGGNILHVRFPTIHKINIGTRVNFAGKPVGEVVAIREIGMDKREEVGPGEVYVYELVLRVDSSVKVYDTDQIAIHTSGLLGERSIAIVPRPPIRGEVPKLINDDVIYAHSPGSMDETIGKFISLALKAEQTMDHVISLIETNNEEIFFTVKALKQTIGGVQKSLDYAEEIDVIGNFAAAAKEVTETLKDLRGQIAHIEEEKMVAEFSSTLRNVKEITAAVNKPEELGAIIANMHALSKQFKKMEGVMDGSWEKVGKSIEEMALVTKNFRKISEEGLEITQEVQDVVDKMVSGQGDLGKLLAREDLYFRARGMFDKMNTVMNDVNHYGLLFHLDKGWQRQRTKRMNLLHNLESAQDFRGFFEAELDQVTTSLSRVSLLLEELDKKPAIRKDSEEFFQGFSELMQKVEDLQENLKIYNQELLEIHQ